MFSKQDGRSEENFHELIEGGVVLLALLAYATTPRAATRPARGRGRAAAAAAPANTAQWISNLSHKGEGNSHCVASPSFVLFVSDSPSPKRHLAPGAGVSCHTCKSG